MEKVLIVGCGDMGKRVAGLVMAEGADVSALVRSAEKGQKLAELGIQPVVGDLDELSSLATLPTRDALVFYFAPPPGGGNMDPRMRSFCASIEAGNEPRRVVYMSTSGVYGDCGDALVTEETPPNPQTARAKRRYDAETVLSEWGRERGVEVVILRVTGIYGPGRLPITQLANGHPLLDERLSPPTNRIHAEDLARVCVAAAEKGDDGDIFNVSDGRVGTMSQYFNAVADILGYPRPRQISLEEAHRVMTPLMLSYISETRRMGNGKMLKKLGIKLLYPTLEEGLKACVRRD
ncbi:SDR family oxidoreductase [Geotalea uraniireducens]|uniref:NAD-dependent epimerase/dehydratase n=1 Tax=Geotalea uraniireducens (strain Rf4) TaxID=351605 RepID=A5GEU6_GEOUR|nr:SDR family oxidoreductase [Geotalea uraniireducens]ABQ25951.1 NAD-dependent epimerase/dehydratase [Geotalea uraniireducens Rf4]